MRKEKRVSKRKGIKRRGRVKKRRYISYLISTGIILFLLGTSFFLVKYREKVFPPLVAKKEAVKLPPEKRELKEVTVYFSDKEGLTLKGERHKIESGAVEDEIKGIVDDLISGPEGEWTQTIPLGTRLLKVEVKQGIAYVDFSKELSTRHTGGSSAELQTVYSIVDSIVFNFSEIKGVQILIEGKKEGTLAGHIDISLPLKGDKAFING